MDRAERTGLAVAIAGHVVLFGLLSVGFLSTPNPLKLKQQPVEVSLVKDVGLEATAPQSVTPPAQSVAPEQGEPEDAAAPAPEEAAPEPEPQPAPPAPAPPQPKAKPAPAKPDPAPAKPAPKPEPAPKPAPVAKPKPAKPAPAKAAPEAKPAPAKAAPTKTAAPAKPAPAKSSAASSAAAAKPAAARGTGTSATAKATRPRGSRLGDDFLKGLSDQPSKSQSETPRAAKIDARAMASIVQAIARQIQPCADRQVNPGPGANEIVTTLNLRLNEDGTLAATPRMVRQAGVTSENDRYAQRVVDLGIAAFKGCSPLRLPAEYYSTASGGWSNINYQWQLR